MNLLLDTHAFLWFIDGNPKLSSRARQLVESVDHTKSVSAATLWEIAIKVGNRRLHLSRHYAEYIPNQMEINGFKLLPLTILHMSRTIDLPFHHRDPFDRMIATQCLEENLTLMSVDAVFDRYEVTRLW